jgi:hypothetical protein
MGYLILKSGLAVYQEILNLVAHSSLSLVGLPGHTFVTGILSLNLTRHSAAQLG